MENEENCNPDYHESWGVKFIVDPSLNKYSNQILFPEKLARAKASLRRITHWLPELEKCKPGPDDEE